MQAIERLSLTPQHSLHLVSVGGRVLLIAVSPGGCTVLDGSNCEIPGRSAGGAMIFRGFSGLPPAVASVACYRAMAATPQSNSLMGIQLSKTGESLSVPMQIVILLTLLTLLPALVMSITPFLRITIVLHFLRQALGTQTTPSNQVLVGIALFLTMLVISPVAADIYHQGWEPLQNNQSHRGPGLRRRREAAESVPGAVRPRKRRQAVPRNHPCARAAQRPPIWNSRPHSGIHSLRAEGRASRSAPCCSCRSSSSTWWWPRSRSPSAWCSCRRS